MDFITLINEVNKNGNVAETMTSWTETLDWYLCKFKEKDVQMYKDLINELYIKAFGEKVNKEMAEKWVKSMQPVGEHWSIDDTKKVLPEYDAIDTYVVANMIYNDYYEILKNNEDIIIRMTANWLDDVDAKENKLYKYMRFIANID